MTDFDRTNYRIVQDWMRKAKQATPTEAIQLDDATLTLREKLIEEESEECIEAFQNIRDAKPGTHMAPLYRDLIKELADVLVVTYGAFAAMGINADLVYQAVMQNNTGKLNCSKSNEIGKLVPNPQAKAQLKAQIIAELMAHTADLGTKKRDGHGTV